MKDKLILQPLEQLVPNHPEWRELCLAHKNAVTLTALVLTAWQMGLWLARAMVCQQLDERAQAPTQWSCCTICGTRLMSKGFVKRRMLTLVGVVEWKRRVGRCPHHCHGRHKAPFDEILGIRAYQQTSTELMRLGTCGEIKSQSF